MTYFALTASLHFTHLALREKGVCAAYETCIICMQMAEAGILSWQKTAVTLGVL